MCTSIILPNDIIKIICSFLVKPIYKFIDIIEEHLNNKLIYHLALNCDENVLKLLDEILSRPKCDLKNLIIWNDIDLTFWSQLANNQSSMQLIDKYWDKIKLVNGNSYIYGCILGNKDFITLIEKRYDIIPKTYGIWDFMAGNINAVDIMEKNWEFIDKNKYFWGVLARNVNAIKLITKKITEKDKSIMFWYNLAKNENAIDYILKNWAYIDKYNLYNNDKFVSNLASNINAIDILNKYYNKLNKTRNFWISLSSNSSFILLNKGFTLFDINIKL